MKTVLQEERDAAQMLADQLRNAFNKKLFIDCCEWYASNIVLINVNLLRWHNTQAAFAACAFYQQGRCDP